MQLRGMDLKIHKGLGKGLAKVLEAGRSKGVGSVELAWTDVAAITSMAGPAVLQQVLQLVAEQTAGFLTFLGQGQHRDEQFSER